MPLTPRHQKPGGLVITDLDGTLLRSDRTCSPVDLTTLELLGQRRILRAIATGRSLYSLRKVIPPSFPIDYIIFSSGAGIIDWRTQKLLVSHHLTAQEISTAADALVQIEIDFMLHHPVPENHYFWYRDSGHHTPDFLRRHQLYRSFALPFEQLQGALPATASQFVAIASPPQALSQYTRLKEQLSALQVIRATSPLDGESLWIEIFPSAVSKALAGAWLAERHQIPLKRILGIGNDYNDLELLAWAEQSFVVNNAPSELKQTYRAVSTNNENGFTQAVEMWINY